MSLAIERFYDELSDLLDLPLFVAEGTGELEKEVTENSHGITVDLSVANEVAAEDLLHFFEKLRKNAKAALSTSNTESMSFYLWHEEGQLWYSFVNAEHPRMPFSEDFEMVETEAEVINSYLGALKKDAVQGKMYIGSVAKA
jgi:hypothetical protein